MMLKNTLAAKINICMLGIAYLVSLDKMIVSKLIRQNREPSFEKVFFINYESD